MFDLLILFTVELDGLNLIEILKIVRGTGGGLILGTNQIFSLERMAKTQKIFLFILGALSEFRNWPHKKYELKRTSPESVCSLTDT